jgi:hypothetical protein
MGEIVDELKIINLSGAQPIGVRTCSEKPDAALKIELNCS